jgi:hypothetical protein
LPKYSSVNHASKFAGLQELKKMMRHQYLSLADRKSGVESESWAAWELADEGEDEDSIKDSTMDSQSSTTDAMDVEMDDSQASTTAWPGDVMDAQLRDDAMCDGPESRSWARYYGDAFEDGYAAKDSYAGKGDDEGGGYECESSSLCLAKPVADELMEEYLGDDTEKHEIALDGDDGEYGYNGQDDYEGAGHEYEGGENEWVEEYWSKDTNEPEAGLDGEDGEDGYNGEDDYEGVGHEYEGGEDEWVEEYLSKDTNEPEAGLDGEDGEFGYNGEDYYEGGEDEWVEEYLGKDTKEHEAGPKNKQIKK